MRTLTREHQAAFNFATAATNLRPIVEDNELLIEPSETAIIPVSLTRYYDSYMEALTSFIMSELHYRQAGRSEVVNDFPDRVKCSKEFGKKVNDFGLESLNDSIRLMKGFKSFVKPKLGDLEKNEGYQKALKELGPDLLFFIQDVEIKAEDVKEIEKEIKEVIKAARKGDGVGILDFLEKKAGELQKVRNRPDRGAKENIALWKLLAIAAMIGIAAWAIYACYWRPRRCSKKNKRRYETAMAIAFMIFGACE